MRRQSCSARATRRQRQGAGRRSGQPRLRRRRRLRCSSVSGGSSRRQPALRPLKGIGAQRTSPGGEHADFKKRPLVLSTKIHVGSEANGMLICARNSIRELADVRAVQLMDKIINKHQSGVQVVQPMRVYGPSNYWKDNRHAVRAVSGKKGH